MIDLLERTKEGHRQSDEHWNRFKCNTGETFQRPGHTYGLFWAHRYHLELNWTELLLHSHLYHYHYALYNYKGIFSLPIIYYTTLFLSLSLLSSTSGPISRGRAANKCSLPLRSCMEWPVYEIQSVNYKGFSLRKDNTVRCLCLFITVLIMEQIPYSEK